MSQTTHKEIESPWTKKKYIIRELDPAVLSIFSKPEGQDVKNIRIKISDVLEDLKAEENRQKEKKEGETDQSKIDAIHAQLQSYYDQIQKIVKLDEKDYENRKKIVQLGLVQPKIKSDDDFLDLGKDATFIYSNIVAMSQVSDDYADIIQGLFRQGQQANSAGAKSG